MRFFTRVMSIALSLALASCSPTFNWRETRIEGSTLTAMLPCKPDRGARVVPLGGRDVELNMTGCETGGAVFAVARADLQDAATVAAVLAQWRAATLANIGAATSTEAALPGPIAKVFPQVVRVSAKGLRQDGNPVQLQAVWFAQGAQVFHAALYADRITADMADSFFSGLKFQ